MINIGRKTVYILGVKIDDITFQSAVALLERLVYSKGLKTVFTINPEMITLAHTDQNFREILNSATLAVPDGIGVVCASKLLKTPVPERISGIDLFMALLNKIKLKNSKVFFLGAKPGVVEKAKTNIESIYKGVNICGTNDGYFSNDKEIVVIEKINNSGAEVLAVCMGSPMQEKWIYKNQSKLKVNLCIGLGGALDIFSGNKKRAPDFLIKLNCEWLFRLLNEPSRIKRFLTIPKFSYLVVKQKINFKNQQ